MRHGTESGYAGGCRCVQCKAGHRAYVAAWRRKPTQVRKRQIKSLTKLGVDAARIATLDAEVERLRRELTPAIPMAWEIERAVRDERDALRVRVVELERQVDQMVDAAIDLEINGAPPAPYVQKPKHRGRPRKVQR